MSMRRVVERHPPPFFEDASPCLCVLHHKETPIHDRTPQFIVELLTKQNMFLRAGRKIVGCSPAANAFRRPQKRIGVNRDTQIAVRPSSQLVDHNSYFGPPHLATWVMFFGDRTDVGQVVAVLRSVQLVDMPRCSVKRKGAFCYTGKAPLQQSRSCVNHEDADARLHFDTGKQHITRACRRIGCRSWAEDRTTLGTTPDMGVKTGGISEVLRELRGPEPQRPPPSDNLKEVLMPPSMQRHGELQIDDCIVCRGTNISRKIGIHFAVAVHSNIQRCHRNHHCGESVWTGFSQFIIELPTVPENLYVLVHLRNLLATNDFPVFTALQFKRFGVVRLQGKQKSKYDSTPATVHCCAPVKLLQKNRVVV
mmetsp:Transcript_38503/g.86452  ORF Transcript_38503/g.86452 Transcript_38503/m.86452 type:complete len:365 (+) Transcript_38503:1067-2161(+)